MFIMDRIICFIVSDTGNYHGVPRINVNRESKTIQDSLLQFNSHVGQMFQLKLPCVSMNNLKFIFICLDNVILEAIRSMFIFIHNLSSMTFAL